MCMACAPHVYTQAHLKATASLVFVLLLFLYACTLLGSSYFGGKLDRCQACTPLPRRLA